VADGRQCDVDGRDVEADDEEAHARDQQDADPAVAAELADGARRLLGRIVLG
jgi:hypothetical protein